MRTMTVDVFKYSELSDKAKEKAWSKSLGNFENPWSSENQDSLEAFEKIFPVKIKDWSYGGRGEGVTFQMTCDDAIENLSGVRLATYIWNNYRRDIYKGKYYSTGGEWINGKYHYKSRHSNIQLEISFPFTGYCADHYLLDPLESFLKKPDTRNFRELLQDCFDNWVKLCSEDAEYQAGPEAFAENAEANEWEFDKDGNQI